MKENKLKHTPSAIGLDNLRNTLVGIASWLRFVFKRWLLIFVTGMLAAVIGFFYASTKKVRYESRLTFALEESESGLGGALNLAAEFGFNIGGGKSVFAGDNIIEIIKSRTIIERVLLQPDTVDGKINTFANDYLAIMKEGSKQDLKDRLDTVSFPLNQPRSSFTYLQDSLLFNLYSGISNGALSVGKPDKKLNIYEISFTSTNERFSKVFTDRLIKETSSYYVEIKTKRSKQTLDILEERVKSIRGSLSSAISSRFSIPDANINPAFSASQIPLQNKQVDIQAYGGAYGELFKNLEMARFQYLKDIPLLQIIDEADYPMRRVKVSRLKWGFLFGAFIVFVVIFGITVKYVFLSASSDSIEKKTGDSSE